MRDKLIDIILAAQGYKDGGDVPEYWQAVYQAEMESRRKAAGEIADALLAAGVVQEWVSVEDALPEEGERVLACDVRGGLDYEVWTLRKDTEPYWMDGEYGWHELGSCSHWMPLPAPPKEE